MKKNFAKKSGFTLVETLVTIGIFVILMAGITLLFKNIYVTSGQQNLSLDTIDKARITTFNFTNEIRNAQSGSNGSFSLNQATASQIIFFSTYGASGTNVNRLRYYIANSTLYKGVIVPSGTPATYNTANEIITSVLPNVLSSTSPLFYYYDGNYAGTSTPLADPINVNQVKFVQMNLIITNQDTRNSTSTFKITAGGTIRNLKNNLGN